MTDCLKCGAEVPAGARVCNRCGAEVTDPGAQTVAIATDAPAAEEQQPKGDDPLLLQLRRALAADYEVERELGRGGMAVVYKALEIGLHRPVALKVLPPGMGLGAAAVRFKREARMAAALDHPNIIPIYRVGLAEGTYFFAMKLVEGRALDAVIESQGALPLPVILAVLRAAVGALAFAHERGTIHRDVKGANILVDRDGRVMVSDFGIARAVEDKTLTASGSVIGTPHFMSPEVCSGGKAGPQSDQYSTGILTFQMITGSVPFDADSLMAILQHHYYTPVPDVRTVRRDLPDGLVQLLQTALAKDPARRYARTADMLAAIEAIPFSDAERRESDDLLKQLARGEQVPKVRTPSLPPLGPLTLPGMAVSAEPTTVSAPFVSAPKRRSRLSLLLAVLLVTAGLAGAAYWLMGRRPAQTAESPIATETPTGPANPASPAPASAAAESVRSDTAHAAPAATPRRAGRAPRRAEPAPTPAAEVAAPTPQGTGMLRLRTIPPTAQIFVDGRAVGVGGLVDFEVPAGRRRLRISAPGYLTLDTLITVDVGATIRLGQVSLRSEGGP